MDFNQYVGEFEDAAVRMRADLSDAIDRYNQFVDNFYYHTLSELTAVADDLNSIIFGATSGADYIEETFDSPEKLADRLAGRDYSIATAEWAKLEIAASMVDTVRDMVLGLKRQLEQIEVAYIGDDLSDLGGTL